jgi:hypothetical protein
MSFRRIEPGQSFSEHIDQQLADFITAIKVHRATRLTRSA